MRTTVLKNSTGFSLLEVVVAILIITIGMIGVTSLVIQNIQTQYINKNILIASGLAQEGLEQLRARISASRSPRLRVRVIVVEIDLDGDGNPATIGDLTAMIDIFKKAGGIFKGDINEDGKINCQDLTKFLGVYNNDSTGYCKSHDCDFDKSGNPVPQWNDVVALNSLISQSRDEPCPYQ